MSLLLALPPSLPNTGSLATLKLAMGQALRLNRYIPQQPTPKQAAFLLLPQREAFFGGAAGPGKSSALLMCGLQYVDVPGSAAIIFRRTYADLAKPGALMDRAQDWLGKTDAKWNGQTHAWRFPSGAQLVFSHLEHENSKYDHQSAEYQTILFDELTAFTETQYRYLFSRLRRLEGSRVPLRIRSASNPGNLGHEWVKQRFLVEGPTHGRPFIPARLDDNPHLDQASYRGSLAELDPVTRAQLLAGDWSARAAGKKFRREWFTIVQDYPRQAKHVRFWDLAATEPKPGRDPDWTAGAKVAEYDGRYTICDMRRIRTTPGGVEALIAQTAVLDGKAVDIWIEQEPGASGVNTIDHYQRLVLKGYAVRGYRNTGDKETRANPVSSAAEAGNVDLLQGPWITDYLDEVEGFPGGGHDDQVDAVSGGIAVLTRARGVPDNLDLDTALAGLTQQSHWALDTPQDEEEAY